VARLLRMRPLNTARHSRTVPTSRHAVAHGLASCERRLIRLLRRIDDERDAASLLQAWEQCGKLRQEFLEGSDADDEERLLAAQTFLTQPLLTLTRLELRYGRVRQ